jgi:tRNA nucleotidyltransferase (CCA-adding enzyme)
MQIIMTHEQADFDALASLLAASLLQADAYALMPKKMNRNVQSFITRYGEELPFYDLKQLPQQQIEKITLVDTQALVTLKGVAKNLNVHVIDHHLKKQDFPNHWSSVFENTGSCVTILIEDLRKNNCELNIIQSTLLLLGIYEDTGSLSYAGTTPRDLRAAAFLLEKGASLLIANHYLNPPLSDTQREIYNTLLSNLEHHEMHGNRIVTAMANAEGLNEEISSIAHKLRDLLDPDALFLMVKTSEGIRLVARSISDQINVGKIAHHFGGGGHPRAAAALIHTANNSTTLEKEYANLLQILPKFIEPAIKVVQIMSKNPLLITPQTSATYAAQLMQRYGYEGYPVVENGQIVGLLNRRSVDRAIQHKLDLTAASLMEAGHVFVDENSSMEDVQKIMTDSGWGQIPVVSADTRQIIGIVTRTDLIKTLGKSKAHNGGTQNLTSLLHKTLSPGKIAFLQLIANHANQKKIPIFIVGGFVRDLILERPGMDFDIVVEGDAIALAKSLQAVHQGKVNTHKRFSTAKWFIKNNQKLITDFSHDLPEVNSADLPESLDFVSARTEFYDYPTALPQVERSNIKLDLHRRDFSINTLALRLDGQHFGELYDFWGGLDDLKDGFIRVLHSVSFVDDPTRLIRAVRFEQRFHFQIEPRTLQLLIEALDLIKQVSGDRIRHEINLILLEADPFPALKRLEELGLTKSIHPDLMINEEIASQIKKTFRLPIPDFWKLSLATENLSDIFDLAYITWFMNLGPRYKSICRRLRLSSKVMVACEKAIFLRDSLAGLIGKKPSEITALLSPIPNEVIYILHEISNDERIKAILNDYVTHWQMVKPFTNGADLQALGIKPGPIYQKILNKLKNLWLDGAISNVDQELLVLEEWLKSTKYNE